MLHANPSLKMPAVTRNQRKNVAAAKPVIVQPQVSHELCRELARDSFVIKMKNLLAQCDQANGKENKMNIALEIYQTINSDMNKLLQNDGVSKWVRFLCTVFDKIIEFETEYRNGGWLLVSEQLVEKFNQELNLAKKFLVNIIKNYEGIEYRELVSQSKDKIAALEGQRPRRNIKRVNYTYMDTIEPECEGDGITDIWFDLTLSEDPDYEFEEDEDDEEEEEEDRTRWAKIHPELSAEEKTELKQHLTKLVDHHRVRRSVARVNYAGMDMSEEDEGQIHIAKRRFEDGKVKYIWKSYSLSEANEIGDEDYVDEV